MKPDFILGLGDTDYIYGKYNWYDQNVGKNYAPYIYPYDYGSGNAVYNNYAYARPNTPPKTYNRFFDLPGNHDLGLIEAPGVNQYTDTAGTEPIGRQSFDKFWGRAFRGSPAVTPLAGSYYNKYPYNYTASLIDYRSDQYYDYMFHPINASGKVMSNLANFYMVDASLSGETKKDGTYFPGRTVPRRKAFSPRPSRTRTAAPWQFFASHYNQYSSAVGDDGGIANMRWNFAGSDIQVVLSGHVHDYERFEKVQDNTKVTYLVQGAGGFDNQSGLGSPPFDNFTSPLQPDSVAHSTAGE